MKFFENQPLPPNPQESASEETPKLKPNTSVRKRILNTASALLVGAMPLAETSCNDHDKTHDTIKTKELTILDRIGITKDQIKPEYLDKFLKGQYEDIVVIDLETQKLNMYDKSGHQVLQGIHISTGRPGMETPKMSCESGKTEILHVNKDNQDMPYSTLLDSKRGIYIHEGSLPGFPASHGCIRTDEETAKMIYTFGKKLHNLVIVIK